MNKLDQEFENIDTVKSRIKKIREILRLPRSYFEEKYNLSQVTLKSWESGNVSKINKSSIERIIKIFKNEGLIVSEEWLISGNGQPPFTTSNSDLMLQKLTSKNEISSDFDEDLINEVKEIQEVESVMKFYKNSIHYYVLDESMSPLYPMDCVVIGRKISNKDFIKSAGKDCIVKIKELEYPIFRRVSIYKQNSFSLHAIYPAEGVMNPIILEPEIEFIAPVIWIRKN